MAPIATRSTKAMSRRAPSDYSQRGQVDHAHERRLVVDDDELLVVAVEWTLSRVERHRDARAAGELLARLPHLAAIRVEQRQRRPRPGKNTHVDSLCRLGQQ